MTTPQAQFDAQYVSGLEIRQRLKIAGCTVSLAIKRGALPEPIKVGAQTYVWERAVIEPLLQEWQRKLEAAKNIIVAPGYE
jgi:predicted DNA-binding transcriptional regulator AlpA